MTNHDLGETTVLGRRTPAAEMPRRAVIFRWAVAGLAAAALIPLIWFYPPRHLEYLLLFSALVIIADRFFPVRVAPGSYFSISSTFLFVYFLIAGATAAALMAALAQVSVWALQRVREDSPHTLLYAAFNAGQHVLATLAGGVAASLAFSAPLLYAPVRANPISRLAVFAAFYLLVSTLLTSLAAYARTGFADLRSRILPTSTMWMAVSFVVGIPFAVAIRLVAPTLGGFAIASLVAFAFLSGIALVLRLNAGLKYGNKELKVINSIGTLINASLNQEEIFAIMARESRRVLFWDAFFIALAPDADERIEMIFFSDTGAELTRRQIARGVGLTGRAIATGELIHYEQGERDRDLEHEDTLRGRRRPRSLVIAPMKFADEVLGAICVQSYHADAYGPSQFRLLQTIAGQAAIALRNAQLFESERQATNERDEFLSLVTHEIKNPLTSIKGYASLAEDALARESPANALEAIRVIEQEAAKILRLTEDLLDASRMSAGRFSVRLESADIGGIVFQIAGRYARTSGRQIDVRVDESVPPIEADSVRLSQVLENLISNAVKYSTDGPIEVALERTLRTVLIKVRDRGNGIPADKIPLIFERFYRLEEEGQTVKGTGLGLYISREIVRMHGGELRVVSEIGEGSTFIVELPVDPAASVGWHQTS